MSLHTTTVTTPARTTISAPARLLRLEGAAVFATAIALYAYLQGSGLWFALLLLVPDLAAVGYAINKTVGAHVYNAVHVYALPLLLGVIGLLLAAPVIQQIALIWLAHIGMDRLAGYGLKYPSDFKDTHLKRV
jgi:hypothetical protein